MLSRPVLSRAARGLLAAALIVPCFAHPPVPASSITPTERLAEKWWAERHAAVVAAAKAHPDTELLMIGDSITNNYDKANAPDENFLPTWTTFFAPRKALNLGFSGDTTAHVVWRLTHGEIDGLHPKVAVVLIGTNNTGWAQQTAEQTRVGIDAVVATLEQRLPETRILLLGILPTDITPEKTAADRAVNAYLATCYGENPRVTYLDIGSIYYKNGAVDASLFYDPRLPSHAKPLHPDTVGQRRMAEAMEPTLAKLMGDAPRVALKEMTDINTALIPVSKLEPDSYDWFARHHAVVDAQRTAKPRVVLIGDSITHFWGGTPAANNHVNGPQAFASVFGQVETLNMGFGWDRTQNVLWRLRHGEFTGLHPQWIVMLIGTNNLTGTNNARGNTPAEIVDGIAAIRDEVLARSPESKLVLMAILPRGLAPTDWIRQPIAETNRLLKERFATDARVTVLDIGAKFLQSDGTLPRALMPDGTHPSEAGYQIWADALREAGVRP